MQATRQSRTARAAVTRSYTQVPVVWAARAQNWNKVHRLQGWTDTDLSEKGCAQAAAAAKELASGRWGSFHALYSSDLKRARCTAEPTGEARCCVPSLLLACDCTCLWTVRCSRGPHAVWRRDGFVCTCGSPCRSVGARVDHRHRCSAARAQPGSVPGHEHGGCEAEVPARSAAVLQRRALRDS